MALGLLSVPFLTRSLGVEGYGLYATISAVVNIALFSESSVSTAVTVFMTKEMTSGYLSTAKPEKYTTLSISVLFVVVLSVTTSTIVFFSASSIVAFFENLAPNQKQVVETAIRIGTGIMFARFVHQFFIGVLQARKVYGIINLLSTSYAIISIASTLYIAVTTQDLVQIQFVQLIIALLMGVVYWYYCRRAGYLHIHFFTKPNLRELSELSRYGFRMWISALGSTLFSQFDRIIVIRLFGAELAGMYAALTSLANQINSMSSMPIQPLLPVLSEYQQTSEPLLKMKLQSIMLKSFTVNAFLIITIAVTLVFFSEQIVTLLFAKKTVDVSTAQMCLIIITSAYSLYSFNAVGYFTLLAIREEHFVTYMVMISGIISLILIYTLSLKFGITGACWGNIGYSFTLILNARAFRKLQLDIYETLTGVGSVLGISAFFLLLNKTFNSFSITITLYLLFITVISVYMERRFAIISFLVNKSRR